MAILPPDYQQKIQRCPTCGAPMGNNSQKPITPQPVTPALPVKPTLPVAPTPPNYGVMPVQPKPTVPPDYSQKPVTPSPVTPSDPAVWEKRKKMIEELMKRKYAQYNNKISSKTVQ